MMSRGDRTPMTERCLRCKRFKRSDGILLCPVCGPTDRLHQNATVTPGVAGGSQRASSTIWTTVEGKGLKVKRDRGMWAHDRQEYEVRDVVTDRERDHYEQTWVDPDTGSETWSKRGRLSDPKMHGKRSHRPSTPKDEKMISVSEVDHHGLI